MAAYASFEHQRRFALDGGADDGSAALWPLSVDSLVILAGIGLLKLDRRSPPRPAQALPGRTAGTATRLRTGSTSAAGQDSASLTWLPTSVGQYERRSGDAE